MISALSLPETIPFFRLEVTYTYYYALETEITEKSSIICKNIYSVFVISVVALYKYLG